MAGLLRNQFTQNVLFGWLPVGRQPGCYFLTTFHLAKRKFPAEVQRDAPKIRRSVRRRLHLRVSRRRLVQRNERVSQIRSPEVG